MRVGAEDQDLHRDLIEMIQARVARVLAGIEGAGEPRKIQIQSRQIGDGVNGLIVGSSPGSLIGFIYLPDQTDQPPNR